MCVYYVIVEVLTILMRVENNRWVYGLPFEFARKGTAVCFILLKLHIVLLYVNLNVSSNKKANLTHLFL